MRSRDALLAIAIGLLFATLLQVPGRLIRPNQPVKWTLITIEEPIGWRSERPDVKFVRGIPLPIQTETGRFGKSREGLEFAVHLR